MKNKNSNLSIGSPSENIGSDTEERYRYQHTYTAILGILILNEKIDYERLICEYHEDILAINKNQKLIGIQVKTRDIEKGGFSDHGHVTKYYKSRISEAQISIKKFKPKLTLLRN